MILFVFQLTAQILHVYAKPLIISTFCNKKKNNYNYYVLIEGAWLALKCIPTTFSSSFTVSYRVSPPLRMTTIILVA